MSAASDPTQKGGVPGNRPGSATRVAKPNGRKIIASAGRDVTKAYNAAHKARAPQVVTGKQNWKTG
jgi:hypothetical protein